MRVTCNSVTELSSTRAKQAVLLSLVTLLHVIRMASLLQGCTAQPKTPVGSVRHNLQAESAGSLYFSWWS